MSEVTLTPRDIEVGQLRAELEEARGFAERVDMAAFMVALRLDASPAEAELSLRKLAERTSGEDRETYIRAADTVARAMGLDMARERAQQERTWQELEELRRQQRGAR